jgi:hypothetical protein
MYDWSTNGPPFNDTNELPMRNPASRWSVKRKGDRPIITGFVDLNACHFRWDG